MAIIIKIKRALIFSTIIAILGVSLAVQAREVIDVLDRKVTVPDHVERILLGEGRLFYSLALLEGDKPFDRIVGWQGDLKKLDKQTYAIYKAKFPEIEKIPLIGNTTADSVSSEKVMLLQPDVAIFSLSSHSPGKESELFKQLEKAGVPVIFIDFRAEPLKNTLRSVKVLGEVLEREEKANAYIDFYQKELSRVTDAVKTIPDDQKTSVFIELKAGSKSDCCTTAANGNMGDFIDLAGGNNIAKPLLPTALGTVNLEKVLDADPDVLILSGAKDPVSKEAGVKLGAESELVASRASMLPLLSRTGIRELTAVKQGKVHAIWHGFYNSPLNILAIQSLATWLYPDTFTELDPKETMNQLYQQFLPVAPTGVYWINQISDEDSYSSLK